VRKKPKELDLANIFFTYFKNWCL